MQHAIVLVLLSLCVAFAQNQTRPNIFVILADDYGWANIGYHSTPENRDEIVTPTLDSLQQSGIELDRHYSFMLCSPSRCSFLSGRNPIHVNVFNYEHNYNPENNMTGFAGVPLNMSMISNKMKDAGYTTHFTGKWDAGFATYQHIPVNRGFDSGFGYFHHGNDYWTYMQGCSSHDLWYNHAPAYNSTNPSYCNQTLQKGCIYEDDRFVSHVLYDLDVYDPSGPEPLFYYWAIHGIHAPLEVPQYYLDKFSFINDTQRQAYSAMVNHMDDIIAMVIEKIRDKGMWDNTLILFMADNGGPLYGGGGANNYPLKGGKMSNWEGGIRVNAFLSGGWLPDELQGTMIEDFIGMEDWYATFCALAGIDPYDETAAAAGLPPIDSHNMWPLISGANQTNPRTEYPIGIGFGNDGTDVVVQGIIVPPYKLLTNTVNVSFWQGPLYPNTSTSFKLQGYMSSNCGPMGCLFNIVEDPGEHNDLSSIFPNVTKYLLERIDYYQSTVFNPVRGNKDPVACSTAKQIYGGFYGPFVNI